MPNYVRNTITVKGKGYELDFAENLFKNLDFETLLPKAKTLNIISGFIDRYADAAFAYKIYGDDITATIKGGVSASIINVVMPNWETQYASQIRDMKKYVDENYPIDGSDEASGRSANISYLYGDETVGKEPKNRDDLVALGEIRYMNRILYGAANWYDWNVKNWGTKWNAMDVTCNREDDSTVVCDFDTAWSFPYGIGCAIENLLGGTNLEITWTFADEDIGHNCGIYTKNPTDRTFTYEDKEDNYEFACEIFGLDADEFREMMLGEDE